MVLNRRLHPGPDRKARYEGFWKRNQPRAGAGRFRNQGASLFYGGVGIKKDWRDVGSAGLELGIVGHSRAPAVTKEMTVMRDASPPQGFVTIRASARGYAAAACSLRALPSVSASSPRACRFRRG